MNIQKYQIVAYLFAVLLAVYAVLTVELMLGALSVIGLLILVRLESIDRNLEKLRTDPES